MCGRYTLLADELTIRNRFELKKEIANYMPSYNIAPGQHVLAIIYDGRERRVGYLKWGLVPSWAKDKKVGNKMINARSETIHEKPSFKHLLLKKRCVIIADSFYEWQKIDNQKVPQRIQLADRGLFAFAGLWDKWEQDGEKLFTCTMLTKDANAFMQNIHHRMPIILSKEQENTWLQGKFNQIKDVVEYVQSIESEPMKAYPVSTYVNYVKNNDVSCIEPLIEEG